MRITLSDAIYQGYGQTELLPIAMMRRRSGSLPFAELQI